MKVYELSDKLVYMCREEGIGGGRVWIDLGDDFPLIKVRRLEVIDTPSGKKALLLCREK